MAAAINVKILGDATSLTRAFTKAERSASGFNRSMTTSSSKTEKNRGALKGMGRTVVGLGAGYLGASGLINATRASWQEMEQSAKVTAQTNAVLKSTGGIANVTAKHIDDLGKSLLAKSGIDDETIRSGENMLLTFRNIRNEAGKNNNIFDQATQATIDMDVALTHGNVTQESLSKSAIRLGKALNDPVKGVTSLRRVGVAFTAAQIKQIKTLEGTGHHLQAQKIILRELTAEFGGSAAALGGTLPGKINIARESFRNLGGVMAEQLVPEVTKAVTAINKFLSNVQNRQKILDVFKSVLGAIAITVRVLRVAFNGLARAVGGSKNAVLLLLGAFVAFKAIKLVASIASITASFFRLGRSAVVAAARVRGARAATLGFRSSLVGKAGLVGAAGVAAFALTTLVLKVTGLDKKLKKAGGAAFDLAAKLGIVNDKGKQFEGKSILGHDAAQSKAIRQQAATLEARGLTPRQAAAKISAARPNVALRDVQVLAGVFGNRPHVQPPIHVHTKVELDGHKVAVNTTKHQNRRRATSRRGP